ncbi:alanine racemase [Pantoea sp. LMR881]|uniref:alanine racemase n=1 Tax=Pantoea sp. LMR881 TaxID=3014336 RepID=UPI0022B00698|nr:alanine racemase [Pantoea sp. LMR881]MCZ4059775.1 alanine racemase [Pantoea sp. LMR881]
MDMNSEANWQRPLFDDRLTPYIEIDAQRLEHNLQRMQKRANEAGVALRPHIKTHKSVWIARRQRELGAKGITVSKPSEGISFIRGGERDLLLAYPVVQAKSITELLRQAAYHCAKITLIADALHGVTAIAEAQRLQPDCELAVAIKVDVGLHRVGVNPDSDDALILAQALKKESLPFAGLVSHAGHAYGAGNLSAISVIAGQEAQLMQSLQHRLHEAGFNFCPVSVGSTPTALAAQVPPGIDEIRPGNYALLDLTACRLGLSQVDELALSVITRVVAVNEHFAIVDAGSKMLSSDKGPHGTNASGFGVAVDEHGNTFDVSKLSEEHGFLIYQGNAPRIGSLLRIFPNHSCAVMAQSDSFVLRHADGHAETEPVSARGNFN